jgi:hypothetical protein
MRYIMTWTVSQCTQTHPTIDCLGGLAVAAINAAGMPRCCLGYVGIYQIASEARQSPARPLFGSLMLLCLIDP